MHACCLLILINFLALCSLSTVSATRKYFFKNGRHRNGFLGNHVNNFIETKAEQSIIENPHVQIKWFNQKLDHFTSTDSRRFKQKYWVNDEYYKPGGPAFIQIGGEGPTSKHWIDTSEGVPDWLKNAQIFNALCFQLEHRFYGDSIPENSLNVTNLKYLSSKQALADIAEFIDGMQDEYNLSESTKWVTFGGSYSGALAAWFRLKYPHMVVGSIASSAPVQAVTDFKEYLEVVGASLRTFSPQCEANVKAATDAVRFMLTSDDGRRELKERLKFCADIIPDNKLDVQNLFSDLAGNFMGVVQYNKDNRGLYADVLTIDHVCGIMLNTSISTVIERYYAVNDFILSTTNQTCLDFSYANFIQSLRDENDGAGARQWLYQTCTEFGYYQTTDSSTQPFGHDFGLDFSLRQCADIFGPQFTPESIFSAIKETNEYYGAKNYKATNVVLINGSIDPWHALGILKSSNPFETVVYINGTAHCANMYPPRESDPAELVQARLLITSALTQWLQTSI